MWRIVSKTSDDQGEEKSRILLLNKVYTVGRQNCDIVITDNATVSRKHATLQFIDQQPNVVNLSNTKLQLKDESKYGTWVNDVRVNKSCELSNGDEVRFGSVASTYYIIKEPFVITTSCLDSSSKADVKELLKQLGGQVVSEWSCDCQLLVMSGLSVTIKVVNSMIHQKYIVTSKYLEDLVESARQGTPPPKPEHYLPSLTESQLNPNEVSFNPNPLRKTLFVGFTFYFLNTKQMKKLKQTIELSGGTVKLIEGDISSLNVSHLTAPTTVVMQCDLTDSTSSFSSKKLANHITELLKRHDKRCIADSEIGYAILYCTTNRHCNPDIKMGGQAFSGLPSQTFSIQQHSDNYEVLAQNTEISQIREPVPKKRSLRTTTSKSVHSTPNPPPKFPRANPITQDMDLSEIVIKCEPKSQSSENHSIDMIAGTRPDSSTIRNNTNVIVDTSKNVKLESIDASVDLMSTDINACKTPTSTGIQNDIKSIVAQDLEDGDNDKESESFISGTGRSYSNVSNKHLEKEAKITAENDVGSVNDWLSREQMGGKNKTDVKGGRNDKGGIQGVEGGNVGTDGVTEANTKVTESSRDDVQSDKYSTNNTEKTADKDNKFLPSKRKLQSEDNMGPKSTLTKRRRKGAVFDSDDEGDNSVDCTVKKRSVYNDNDDEEVGDGDLFSGLTGKKQTLDASKLMRKNKSEKDVVVRREKVCEKDESFDEKMEDDSQKENRPNIQVNNKYDYVDDNVYDLGEYLNTALLTKKQISACVRYEHADDLPSAVVQSKFVNLIRHSTKSCALTEDPIRADGKIMWQGKLVNNFKTFKKNYYKGANQLPRIIGGRDLVIHVNNRNADVQEMFRMYQQEESQCSQEHQLADALFEMSFNKKVKGGKMRF